MGEPAGMPRRAPIGMLPEPPSEAIAGATNPLDKPLFSSDTAKAWWKSSPPTKSPLVMRPPSEEAPAAVTPAARKGLERPHPDPSRAAAAQLDTDAVPGPVQRNCQKSNATLPFTTTSLPSLPPAPATPAGMCTCTTPGLQPQLPGTVTCTTGSRSEPRATGDE